MDGLQLSSPLSEPELAQVRQVVSGFVQKHFRHQWNELERLAIMEAQGARATVAQMDVSDGKLDKALAAFSQEEATNSSIPETKVDALLAGIQHAYEAEITATKAAYNQALFNGRLTTQIGFFCSDVVESGVYEGFEKALVQAVPKVNRADIKKLLFSSVVADLADTRAAILPPAKGGSTDKDSPKSSWADDILSQMHLPPSQIQ